MIKKLKIVIELFLERLPEKMLGIVSRIFMRLKRFLSLFFPRFSFVVPLIRLCDFVIVRTNGDRFIEFELSNICNAQCIFCPYPDMLRTDKKFMNMSDEILEKSIVKLAKFRSSLISFTPTTGDTLLHPNWDRYIMRILRERGIAKATMFTNVIKLDDDNIRKFIKIIKSDKKGKMSEVYFSVGGLDRATYKTLYQVDRFDLVRDNINAFMAQLKAEGCCIGIHIHVKLLSDENFEISVAESIFNTSKYPFVYYSKSNLYLSNDAYKRNAAISYYPDEDKEKKLACAYLSKTRFAADGGVWADGCVISEMPGDSSLKLGHVDDDWELLEGQRDQLINQWEKNRIIPPPCRGCTMYHARKR